MNDKDCFTGGLVEPSVTSDVENTSLCSFHLDDADSFLLDQLLESDNDKFRALGLAYLACCIIWKHRDELNGLFESSETDSLSG